MLSAIDAVLDRITMYRLVLYYLLALIAIAASAGFFGLIPYMPLPILLSAIGITVISLATNILFATVFAAPVNTESAYITALILTLIVPPATAFGDLPFIFWVAVLSMASKYILAIRNKHIFNPVAIAVALTAIGIDRSATWWIGDPVMAVPVALGGLLIARKMRREDMVFAFLASATATGFFGSIIKGANPVPTLTTVFIHSPFLFFAFAMLTEPLTTPPTKTLQIAYGVLTGILSAPQIHIGSVYSTPELALLAGNAFSYLVSPKGKLILTLEKTVRTAPDTYDFVFPLPRPLAYAPGQYMEWTLAHAPDSRGNRRYFTLASSPTEKELRIGVKFPGKPSSFKRMMLHMEPGTPVMAGGLAGDFTLPSNQSQKLAFIAGGIGVTPFRSMAKYLTDTGTGRDIVMLYAERTADDIGYRQVFAEAERRTGMRVRYYLTDKTAIPRGWQGGIGRIDRDAIRRDIPDYAERTFYLSGPHGMVTSFEASLKTLGIPEGHIKTDFFPGFA